MADITWTDVLGLAPELTSAVISVAGQTVLLAFVNELPAGTECHGMSDAEIHLARIWLAAHLGAVSKNGRTGAAGPVTSEAAGALRRSYGLVALSGADAGLGSTFYGAQYLSLLRMSPTHGPILI